MIVLHLIKTTTGGVWALRQIAELVRLGCVVHVALPDDQGLYAAYKKAGAQVHVINTDIARLKNPVGFLAAVIALRALVRLVRPDIVHSHFVGTTLFMRLALCGLNIPRIFQVPGPLHLESGLTRFVETWFSSESDYWIASCEKTRQMYLAEGIRRDHVYLAFYGTDVERFSPGHKGYLRGELGLAADARIVGMVAYAYPPKKWLGQKRGIKGHEDLIDAVKIARERDENIVAVFVGGPWGGGKEYYEGIVAYGRQALGDAAYFLGTRADVHAIYPDFDVAVHPSHSENLGGAGESLLMGIPTIATDIGGFPDIVRNGETGWLVPARNPVGLAAGILAALADPVEAERRAQQGRQFVRRELDVAKTSGDVADIYAQILSISKC